MVFLLGDILCRVIIDLLQERLEGLKELLRTFIRDMIWIFRIIKISESLSNFRVLKTKAGHIFVVSVKEFFEEKETWLLSFVVIDFFNILFKLIFNWFYKFLLVFCIGLLLFKIVWVNMIMEWLKWLLSQVQSVVVVISSSWNFSDY